MVFQSTLSVSVREMFKRDCVVCNMVVTDMWQVYETETDIPLY